MSSYRFHQAARDGFLDVLRDATRRDCNAHDEDGLTPTMWAAFHGNLEALRLLIGRGGDPDKCDHYGNTALHLAAAEGHLNCVSFLINFGANLWALDNDFHTAKDRAGIREREEILRFLDSEMAEQNVKNKKLVASLKEKALAKAEKHRKASEKLHKEAAKRAKDEEKRLQKERQKMMLDNTDETHNAKKDSRPVHSSFTFSDIVNTGTAAKKTLKGVQKRLGKKKDEENVTTSEFKVAEQVNDGKRSMRSLSGLRRGSEVLYVPKFSSTNSQLQDIFEKSEDMSKSRSEPDFSSSMQANKSLSGLFERPGFGSMAFRKTISGTLMSLPSHFEEQFPQDNEQQRKNSTDNESDHSVDSLDDNEEDNETKAIITFLATNNLSEFIPRFLQEQIDLDALMLLTDDDLQHIVQPLGPRRKLIHAIQQRKEAIEDPGEVLDSRL